jgi:hypothetical protein
MNRLLVLVLLAGCGPSNSLREPDELDATLNPPTGCGSDENWRTFDERELGNQVTVDDTQAPWFTQPMDGMSFPQSPPPTLAWQPTMTLPGKPLGDATCSECPQCGALTAAHLPPVSGDVYDLQFSVGGAVVYRIIYTSQSWTPPAALWAGWTSKTVTLKAFRMQLKVNDVQAGPFTATKPLTFRVGP